MVCDRHKKAAAFSGGRYRKEITLLTNKCENWENLFQGMQLILYVCTIYPVEHEFELLLRGACLALAEPLFICLYCVFLLPARAQDNQTLNIKAIIC